MALGKGEINAERAGEIFDSISHIETDGSTHNAELARDPMYLQAIKDWQKARERIRREATT